MADVPAALADWSSTDSSNAPDGTVNVGPGLDDNLRAIQGGVVRGLSHKGADIASATTTDLGAIEGLSHTITGTTTITGFGTIREGVVKVVEFAGALTLTHSGTSLILPGAANITTAAGDIGIFQSEGSGNWRCLSWMPAGKTGSGSLVYSASPTFTGTLNCAALTASSTVSVTGTTNATVNIQPGGIGSSAVLNFKDQSGTVRGVIASTDGSNALQVYAGDSATKVLDIASANFKVTGIVTPEADNTRTLGTGALRWSVVYAGTGTINTSDAREKTSVTAMTAAELAASKEIAAEVGTFKYLDAIAKKGDVARLHVGMTVQRAIEIMQSHGLDPFAYGFICYDEWTDEYQEIVAEDGELAREITRQKTSPQEREEIQIVNDVPTLVSVSADEPQFKQVGVVDEAGNPVMKDGAQVTHPVPVMETVEERYNRVLVKPAGNRYGFRPDELLLFVARGLEARLTAANL